MITILFVDQKDFFGGGQVFLVNLVSSLDTQRFAGFVVSAPNSRLAASLSKRKIDHAQIEFGRIQKSRNPVTLALNIVRSLIPTLRLMSLIRERGADVICANDVYSYLSSLWAARLTGKPIVLIAHMSAYPRSFFMRQILRGADAIVAVTGAVMTVLAEIEPSGKPRMSVIPNGITLTQVDPGGTERIREEWGADRGTLLIGAIGRLSAEKGIDILLRSAADVIHAQRKVKFVVVGEGPEAPALAGLAYGLGIGSSVAFTGFREDIPAVLRALDVVVIPSLTEGLPLILLEAMNAGKPVIATAVGGIPDVLRDGLNGVLIPPADPQALASALLTLMDDGEKRSDLGRNARAATEGKFALSSMAKEYGEIFMSLGSASRKSPV